MSETLCCSSPEPGPVTAQMLDTATQSSVRAEIDTSAPFESVKEAVTRFGGSAAWKPTHHKLSSSADHSLEDDNFVNLEEQTAQLEKDLIRKERETLDVLKELESTKRIVEELKMKLQKEESEPFSVPDLNSDSMKIINDAIGKENCIPENVDLIPAGPCQGASVSPGMILMELKQAKVNLNRTTSDIVGIRASVESLNKRLEKERFSLEKTRERLTLNSVKILSLEEELNRTRLKLQLTKDAENSENPVDISKELQKLSSEAEQFKKMAEASRSEVSKTMAEIEQTKTSIRTAEIRWHAAKKMEEAARAAEVVALAEIKALTKNENANTITLSFEEYTTLTRKARAAEETSKKRIEAAMLQVDEAEISKRAILRKVEEVSEEVKMSQKALEEALNRVEAANRGKLAVEEALRKWRSEHSQKKRSVHNNTKFKNPGPSHHRKDSRLLDLKDSRLLDLNGVNLDGDGTKSVLRPTLSIGQILSRKLMFPEEFEIGVAERREKPKVSLGQMLSKRNVALSPPRIEREAGNYKQFSAKRKKFGFGRISLLLAKQSMKKKKKRSISPR